VGKKVDESKNNHAITVKVALSTIGSHLDFFNYLSKEEAHRMLGTCAWIDLISLIRKKMPPIVRDLAKDKL